MKGGASWKEIVGSTATISFFAKRDTLSMNDLGNGSQRKRFLKKEDRYISSLAEAVAKEDVREFVIPDYYKESNPTNKKVLYNIDWDMKRW